MGNRAIVVFAEPSFAQTGEISEWGISCQTYLQWNGGPESIYQFLAELDRRKIRADEECESARFIHIVCDYFDTSDDGEADGLPRASSLSCYLWPPPASMAIEELCRVASQADNGLYLVTRTKGHRRIRRFSSIKELSPQRVGRERKAAERWLADAHTDPERMTITRALEKFRPLISKYNH